MSCDDVDDELRRITSTRGVSQSLTQSLVSTLEPSVSVSTDSTRVHHSHKTKTV
jgi:hypothetical protein